MGWLYKTQEEVEQWQKRTAAKKKKKFKFAPSMTQKKLKKKPKWKRMTSNNFKAEDYI